MSKPEDIPQDVWASAWDHAEPGEHTFVQLVEMVARAAMAAKAEERTRWAAAALYFERYCQDEAEDVENCVCGLQQHEDAKAFAAVVGELKS